MKEISLSILLLFALGSFAGCAADDDASIDISIASFDGDTKTVRGALTVKDAQGDAIELTTENTTVLVETRTGDGAWSPVNDATVRFGGPSRIDTVLVADNSGSLGDDLDEIKTALSSFSHLMLAGHQNDRVALVRVSTDARVEQDLTASVDEFDLAIDGLFITNGWTSLWDGVRMANEVLNEGSLVATEYGNSYCVDGSYRATVVFTDGQENNSSDEHVTSYPGDGVDTILDDLLTLQVNGVETPVFVVGVGADVDTVNLTRLAVETGGEYQSIAHYRHLKGALESAGAQMQRAVPVCFSALTCSDDQARVTVSVTHQGAPYNEVIYLDLPGSCDIP